MGAGGVVVKQRFLHIGIAIDQLAYVLLTLGAGSPDETLSAAAWRTERAGKWLGRVFRPLIDALFLPFERDHCETAYLSELRGLHLPPEYHREDAKGLRQP